MYPEVERCLEDIRYKASETLYKIEPVNCYLSVEHLLGHGPELFLSGSVEAFRDLYALHP